MALSAVSRKTPYIFAYFLLNLPLLTQRYLYQVHISETPVMTRKSTSYKGAPEEKLSNLHQVCLFRKRRQVPDSVSVATRFVHVGFG